MSVSFGFYNSLNGDRKYSATQLSSLFDGLIVDGVFSTLGTAFVVRAAGGNVVNVGSGKAWFNHTWTLNDTILPLEASDSDLLVDRIDAVILEVNAEESVRENTIKVIDGVPASEPSRPTLVHDGLVNQYALCYIYRTAGSTEITQADITNVIGTEETPIVTGILQTISLDELSLQWQGQLDELVENETAEIDAWTSAKKEEIDTWLADEKTNVETWTETEQAEFEEWLLNLETQLSGDVAGNLQVQINQINREIRSGITYITLYANDWVNDESMDGSYTQTINIEGITVNSKIDLQPNATIFNQLIDDGVAVLLAENDNGVAIARTIDGKPTVDITIQATVTDSYNIAGEETNATVVYSDGNLDIT